MGDSKHSERGDVECDQAFGARSHWVTLSKHSEQGECLLPSIQSEGGLKVGEIKHSERDPTWRYPPSIQSEEGTSPKHSERGG